MPRSSTLKSWHGYDPRFQEPALQLAAGEGGNGRYRPSLRFGTSPTTFAPHPAGWRRSRTGLAALDRLKRKYGQTLAEVIAYGAEAATRFAEDENRDALLLELKAKEVQDATAYQAAATQLTASSTDASRRLEKLAEAQINDLAMSTRFNVRVTAQPSPEHWTAYVWDQVECLIATNAGEPMKPLHEIASGGEMSRVMLALKVTVEEATSGAAGRKKKAVLPRTLVFDEIDIGIGGRAAEAVGKKLKMLSKGQQVLCTLRICRRLTLPFGDQHFLIEKTEKRGRTQTDIRRMEDPERTREIARMLQRQQSSPRQAWNTLNICWKVAANHTSPGACDGTLDSGTLVSGRCIMSTETKKSARCRVVFAWRLRVRNTAPTIARRQKTQSSCKRSQQACDCGTSSECGSNGQKI